jgi:hypothetical protein
LVMTCAGREGEVSGIHKAGGENSGGVASSPREQRRWCWFRQRDGEGFIPDQASKG